MINESSYASDVADELGLTSSAYAEDVTGEVDLTSAAYGEDVAEAINEQPVGTPDLRVMQFNIGHFNMGYAAAPTGNNPNTNNVLINSNKSDGYPNSVDRNYAIQLQRWKDCIDEVDADIIGIEEYNKYFGWKDNVVKELLADTDIFDGYNVSAGRMGISLVNGQEVTHGWQWNALASKYAMSAAGDEELGSAGNNVAKCYARYATVTIKGRQVIIASTHLNWAQNNDAVTSRALEIQHLINWLKDEPYVILMGDFNTDGVYKSNKADQDYLDGASAFDPFIDAGFMLANHGRWGDLKTAYATGSRPDQPKSYPYTYIDNIIVKGFTMSNVQVIDDGRLTDHCAVYCDLTLIEP